MDTLLRNLETVNHLMVSFHFRNLQIRTIKKFLTLFFFRSVYTMIVKENGLIREVNLCQNVQLQ